MNTNNPKLTSWIEVKEDSDFPIQNLPFGIFKATNQLPRVGVAIGEEILDLHELHQADTFHGIALNAGVYERQYLNDFIALGRKLPML